MKKIIKFLRISRPNHVFNISLSFISILGLLATSGGIVLFSQLNSASADSVSVGASKDSWVDQAHTSDNHGNDSELKVKSKNNSDNRRTYVAFDISTLPSNAVVQSATMSLWMKTNSSQDRTYGVYRVTADWTEGAITWSNKSATASTTTDTTSTGSSNNVFISWDVTSDVQAFKAGTYSNYGWMVRDETEDNSSSQEKKFKSKEDNTSTERPKLEIVYDVIEPTGSISGHNFNDLDGDGEWYEGDEWNEGESPLSDWTITLSNGDETTTDENGYYTFDELEDDNYTVCEVMPESSEDEWTQTWPTADDGADCDGTYGHGVTITNGNPSEENNFGNVQYGSITIIKETIPSGYEEGFTFTVTDQDNQVLSDGQLYTYENLIADNYTVQEVVPDGWTLSNINCVYDQESVGQETENGKVVSLEAGDDVVCTFTNTKKGSITVHKNVLGIDGQTDVSDGREFSVTLNNETKIVAEGNSATFTVNPGTYSVSESSSDGYELVNNTGPVTVGSNGQATINLINEQLPATVTVVKVADPDDVGDFTFTLTFPDNSSDSLQIQGSEQKTFSDLSIGEYSLAETEVPDGWNQNYPNSPSCQKSNSNSSFSPTSISILPGDSVTCTFNNTQLGSISGMKWDDLNGNGIKDNSEIGIAGWNISISSDDDLEISGDESVNTDEFGNYSFTNLLPGDYTVCEEQQNDWTRTYPEESDCQDVMVASSGENQNNENINFGNFKTAKISGIKFNDLNGNGEKDDGEAGLDGWEIKATKGDDIKTFTTEESGLYEFVFEASDAGEWVISETLQTGWIQKFPQDPSTYAVNVASGLNLDGQDFGNFKLATVSGFKWDDKNGNGKRDFNDVNESGTKDGEEEYTEPGLQDVTVALGRVNGESRQEDEHEVIPIEIIAMSLTGVDGGFEIKDVDWGHYKLFEEKKSGWQATNPAPQVDSFFDITYRIDLPELPPKPESLVQDSFFDVFVELSGQNVNQSEETHTILTTTPSVPLEFGNYQLLIISDETEAGVEQTSATITWKTDRPGTSRVIYDTVSHPVLGSSACLDPYGSLACYEYANTTSVSDTDPKVMDHSVIVTGLTPGTTYFFRTVSTASPESVSGEFSRTTSTPSPTPTPTPTPNNSGGGGGGGGIGTFINGPGVTPTPTPSSTVGSSAPTSSTTPTLTPISSVSPGLNVASAGTSATTNNSSGESNVGTPEEEIVNANQLSPENQVTPTPTPTSQGLLAAIGNIFSLGNLISYWWLIVILVLAIIFMVMSGRNKKRKK